MGLADFLYRCPRCGHDPTIPEDRSARCSGCGALFSPLGARIAVAPADAPRTTATAAELAEAMARMGGPWTAATDPEGLIRYAAQARLMVGDQSVPIRSAAGLMGFMEDMEPGGSGLLELTDASLVFTPDSDPASKRGPSDPVSKRGPSEPASATALALDAIDAIQTSSSAVQVRSGAVLYAFRFATDSPLRWETLLRGSVQRRYREQGRGVILEFQPRIVTR